MQLEKLNSILLSVLIYIGIFLLPFKEIFGDGKIVYVVTLIIFIIFIIQNKKIDMQSIYLFLGVSTFFILDGFFHSLLKENLVIYLGFLKFGFLFYLISRKIKNVTVFSEVFYKMSLLAFIMILYYLLISNSIINYMSIGVSLTYIFISILLRYGKGNKKYIDIIYMVVVMVLTLIYGNRMSLLTMLLLLFILFIISMKEINLKNIGLISFGSILVFFLINNLDYILESIWTFLVNHNISSYSVYKLTHLSEGQGSAITLFSSGRDSLYTFTIESLKNNNFQSLGIGYFSATTEFQYPHNIFLELLTTFGLFAIIILIYFIVSVYTKLKKIESSNRYLCIFLLCFSISRLLVSSSFWIDSSLWMFLGFLDASFYGRSDKDG